MHSVTPLTGERKVSAIRQAAAGVLLDAALGATPALPPQVLARLLSEIAKAWESTLRQPISDREALRWSATCAAAHRVAEELNR